MVEIDPEGIESRKLLAAVDLKDTTVLEVGCGDGRLTFKYAEFPRRVVGIEPAALPLTTAQSNCSAACKTNVHFAQATAMALPFRDSTFDVVLLAKSL